MRRGQNDEGAVAVITAITLTVLLLMAAFAIDLGMVRVDTAREQSASDMAAAAGAKALDVTGSVWNAEDACDAALQYARANVDPSGSLALSPAEDGQSCAGAFGGFTECPEAALADPDWQAPFATYDLGSRYKITITLPVPDGDPLMRQVSHGIEWDGLPCERVGVSIRAGSTTFFAGAGGVSVDGSERGAVGRAYVNDGDEAYASLIVLHPTACQSLVAQNTGTRIAVGSRNIGGEFYPGVITLYPVPPGCSPAGKPVINTGGSGSWIRVDGLILSFGLERGVPRPRIYLQEDIDNDRVSPKPVRGPATTRSDIDHLYNCIDGYPTGAAPRWSPGRDGYINPYSECTAGGPNHIQQLSTAYQSMTAATVPDGWLVFPDDWEDKKCNGAELDPSEPLPAYTGGSAEPPPHFGKRLLINCTGSGTSRFEPAGFTLDGWEVAVLRGQVWMSGVAADFAVLGPEEGGTILYIQGGNITRNGGPIRLESTVVYQHDGTVNIGGSGDDLIWTPPHDSVADGCTTHGTAPSAECFAKLAYWSNSASDVSIDGTGAILFLQGIFFTPNSQFDIGGGGNDVALLDCEEGVSDPAPRVNLRDAQMWASQILVRGSAAITLCPSPEFGAPIEFPGSGLIR